MPDDQQQKGADEVHAALPGGGETAVAIGAPAPPQVTETVEPPDNEKKQEQRTRRATA